MTDSNNEQYFIGVAIECGAVEAKMIPPSTVETGTWVQYKCQFGCLFYGKYLVCPPYTPDADEMRKTLFEYNRAILFQIAPKTPEESKEIVAAMEKNYSLIIIIRYLVWVQGRVFYVLSAHLMKDAVTPLLQGRPWKPAV